MTQILGQPCEFQVQVAKAKAKMPARSSSRGQKRAAPEPEVVKVPPLVEKLTMVLEALMATQAEWKFCAPVAPVAMGRRVIETHLIIFN